MTKPTSTIKCSKDMPYGIGSDTLPGLAKSIEEMGEAITEMGKILQTGEMGDHWDGKGNLKTRVENEMSDVIASIAYFGQMNELDMDRMEQRTSEKLKTFLRWDANIQAGRDPNDDGEE